MQIQHDCPNSAFHILGSNRWIEIFHSRPSWSVSQISYRKDDEQWTPFGHFQLIDASEIRPGFRVFRIEANRLEFRLANLAATVIDSNCGMNYIVDKSGRYVVESGNACRRVSDAQISDCIRVKRPADKYVELSFQSDPLWRKCYLTYAKNVDEYNKWRKFPMRMVEQHYGSWFHRIEIDKGVNCAFTDGAYEWDSNQDRNYHIRLPGQYIVGSGGLTYNGPSRLDIHGGFRGCK